MHKKHLIKSRVAKFNIELEVADTTNQTKRKKIYSVKTGKEEVKKLLDLPTKGEKI